MTLIIGIDISILNHRGGVKNYILHLLNNIRQIRPEYQYKLYFNSIMKVDLPIDSKYFKVRSTRIPNRVLQYFWLRLGFPPVEWFLGNIDLFHSPAHSPVYAICPPTKKWVVTVHDLFTFKLNYKKSFQEKELAVLRRMEQKADKVITVSQSTRNDLLEIIPSLEPRTVVINEGVDNIFSQSELSIEVLNKYKIKSPYILYLGAANFHKNLLRLVNVFNRLSEKNPHFLVIAGKLTERHHTIIKQVKDIGIEKRVIFTGSIKEEDLPSLYKGADLFVLPSLYEGFGLVLLEAMASGTPVAASNISSIPEVVGDAALLFDPYNEEDIYNTINTVISNDSLRNSMKIMGIERARLFSWEKMANETLKIYEEVTKS